MGTLLLMGLGAMLSFVLRCYWPAMPGSRHPENPALLAQRQQLLAAAARRQQALARLRQRQNFMARRFQIALLQIGLSPDFRRAASCARQARIVPIAFRQRQFQRFRPQLVQHFAARLAAGVDAELLTTTLTTLVQALGLAAFEADYIRGEVEGAQRTQRRPEPSYPQRLHELCRQHEERLTSLQNLPGIDVDTREQLSEAEDTRFREELLRLGQQPPTAT